jgi:DNA-binding MarR family transcriptional regulator
MGSYKNISELVLLYDEYCNTTSAPDWLDFGKWLQHKHEPVRSMKQHLQTGAAGENIDARMNETDTAIGILLGMMNKFVKHYSKAVMEKLPINTTDEFGYLAHLSTHENLSKTELIHRMMDGKTTGMEIIRRLVNLGLVRELENMSDKRSILLELTAKGRKVIGEAYNQMARVSKEVTGDLTVAEKKQLHGLLSRLMVYHQQHEAEIIERLSV